jgi:glutamyl-tRNA reductase
VVGETQIQTQVREAHRTARGEDASTPSLEALFHAASRAGRRVRQETAVGAAQDAFVRTAADMASEALGTLEGSRAVVVGAGTMASLAVHHLRERGAGPVRILNRSIDRARALAERTASDPAELETLPAAIADADLVISATGAAGLVIREEDVRRATTGHAGRSPLVLIDLAMPRDVEPAVASVPSVRLVDIFALRERVASEGGPAEGELARAHEIVAEEVRRWVVRRRGDELAPLIKALRDRGDEVVRAELDRRASRLGELTLEQHAEVESLARAIAAKLLHDPIVELKERTEPGSGKTHAKVLAELLRLELDQPDA